MLTVLQQKKILTRITQLEGDIDILKKARLEAATSGFASATISSAGGSKSYTRLDISKITELISALTTELKQLRGMLSSANGQQSLWQNVLVVYS